MIIKESENEDHADGFNIQTPCRRLINVVVKLKKHFIRKPQNTVHSPIYCKSQIYLQPLVGMAKVEILCVLDEVTLFYLKGLLKISKSVKVETDLYLY